MNYSFLTKTAVFRGTSDDEIRAMLSCLRSEVRNYKKGEIIYHAGQTVQSMGLVLSGAVNIESDDIWGNKSILSHVAPGQIFAETYACIPGESLMVSVAAAEDAEVLFLNTFHLMQPCHNACTHHTQLIRNLLMISAQKNLSLSRRMAHTASKSIRGRLVAYLSDEASRQGSFEFAIPFNRQQLADYLGVDRSALSAELSKMKKDGMLDYEKSSFRLNEGQFSE